MGGQVEKELEQARIVGFKRDSKNRRNYYGGTRCGGRTITVVCGAD